jgi:hypothetical protein
MKGIVLTEFVDFVATRLPGALPEGGAPRLSPVESYPDEVLATLVERVSTGAGIESGEILRRFGAHLFARFVELYPVFFFEADSALDFLAQVNGYVHDEVAKLHPDARFPHFELERRSPGRLEMTYRSERPLADLAEGMIRGCVSHFGEHLEVVRADLPTPHAPGCAAHFSIVRAPRG